MIQLVSASKTTHVPADPGTDALWITAGELHDATGWQVKPEGLCKDDACVPLAPSLREQWIDGDRVEAAGLWRSLDRPVLHDAAGTTWTLGEGAEDRARQLASLEAPDFTLADLDGQLHSLSDHRGKKVLLATWASW